MQPRFTFSQKWRAAEQALAGFLVAWILLSSLFAANPVLHHALHDDADQSSHHCAITLIEKHQLLASDAITLSVKLSFSPDEKLSPSDSVPFSVQDLRLAPGRAPPV